MTALTIPSRASDVAHDLRWNNFARPAEKVALFVSYSPDSIIPTHAVYYLRALRAGGYQIFLIQQTDLPPTDVPIRREISPDWIDAFLIRENVGIDFGAWSHALQACPILWESEDLLFANDSVFGPIQKISLETLFLKIDRSPHAFLGLTESFEFQHHIQSYFFVLKKISQYRAVYRQFWNQVVNLPEKWEAILRYETQQLRAYCRFGLSYEIFFPIQAQLNCSFWVNPTVHFWSELLKIGFPFLKTAIVREQPCASNWRQYIKATYPVPMVEEWLQIQRQNGSIPEAAFRSKADKKRRHGYFRQMERKIRMFRKRLFLSQQSPVSVPFAFKVDGLNAWLGEAQIAVVLHIFYVETMEEIFFYLKNISVPFHLFISTDTEAKKSEILAIIKRHKFNFVEIRLSPNRGRDIAPKWLTFADVYNRYEFFLHLHGKKSFQDVPHGEKWRKLLLQTLVGSEAVVASNLQVLRDSRIGVVYPTFFGDLFWSINRYPGIAFLRRISIEFGDREVEFPAGSMYWGRSSAFRPLLNLHLQIEEFQEEAGQIDGTLAHVIERSINLIAHKSGYAAIKIAPEDFILPNVRFRKLRNAQQLERLITTTVAKQLPQANLRAAGPGVTEKLNVFSARCR